MINEVAQKWLEIKIFTQISGLKKNKKTGFLYIKVKHYFV